MALKTCAEIIKDVLDSYDWSSDSEYTTQPDTGIIGITDLDTLSEDRYILLSHENDDPEFTYNGVRLSSPQYCMLELSEVKTTERDKLYAAIQRCFQDSSYDITFSSVKPDDRNMPYTRKMRVKILN